MSPTKRFNPPSTPTRGGRPPPPPPPSSLPSVRPRMGGDHEIMLLDNDVGDLRVRELQRKRLPVVAGVEGNVNAVLGAGVQEARPLWILADGVHVVRVPDAGDNRSPRPAEIAGLEEVRLAIILQVVLD